MHEYGPMGKVDVVGYDEFDRPSTSQVGGNHYRHFAVQPTEFILKNGLTFLEGNVIKYVCRHRYKGKAEDIKKAIHYLELLLEWEYDNEGN